MRHIIKNISNLDVASNEYATRHSLQRVVDRLFENDKLLHDFYKEIMGEMQILEYDEQSEYTYNQIIWFMHDARLYVLRCDKNKIEAGSLSKFKSASTTPFSSFGWLDLNPDIDIFQQFGLEKKLNTYMQRFFKQHANDLAMHKYGKLSYDVRSKDSLDGKIARRDLSNLRSGREQLFFPNKTSYLIHDENGPIQNGYARWYDNGLLEYDIIFRLGYAGFKEIDSEYGISADVLSCNGLDFTNDHSMDEYFLAASDKSMFAPSPPYTTDVEVGETLQVGRNDYVNVYTAKIEFAKAVGGSNQAKSLQFEFEGNDYMIFNSNVMCQDKDIGMGGVSVSQNSIVYCAKTPASFYAVLVEYCSPQNYSQRGFNATHNALMSNSFHCHVIGKGKQR